jgi:hypothetical protein
MKKEKIENIHNMNHILTCKLYKLKIWGSTFFNLPFGLCHVLFIIYLALSTKIKF